MKLVTSIILLLTASISMAQGVPNSFTAGTPAIADEVNENFDYLDTRASENAAEIASLVSRIAAAEALIASLQTQLVSETEARLAAEVQLQQLISAESDNRLSADEAIFAELDAVSIPESLLEIADYVELVAQPVNGLSGPHIIFTGVNVHVRSGYGSTSDGGNLSGLGNLVVGYNEPREQLTEQYVQGLLGRSDSCGPYNPVFDPYDFAGADEFPLGGTNACGGTLTTRRSGSHNLIVGDYHNFNSYGGVIGGMLNATDEYAVGASILGGMSNLVTHPLAAIAGGSSNIASSNKSTIVGGMLNRTFNWWGSGKPLAPVAAGELFGGTNYNTVIAGGMRNQAGQRTNVIVGGDSNDLVTASNSVIVGGFGNYMHGSETSCNGSCEETVILGGRSGTATGDKQVQPVDAVFEALAALHGAGSCSDETVWYLDTMSVIPFIGPVFGLGLSWCAI